MEKPWTYYGQDGSSCSRTRFIPALRTTLLTFHCPILRIPALQQALSLAAIPEWVGQGATTWPQCLVTEGHELKFCGNYCIYFISIVSKTKGLLRWQRPSSIDLQENKVMQTKLWPDVRQGRLLASGATLDSHSPVRSWNSEGLPVLQRPQIGECFLLQLLG